MIKFEFIRLAWETVRSHKLRSALTLLGMIIGVFAIIVAVTAVEVIKSSATTAVESFGSTTFSVERKDTFSRSGTGVRGRQRLTYKQMEQLAQRSVLPAAVSASMGGWMVEARYRDKETDPVVIFIGSNQHFLGNNGFEMSQGRFLTEQDVHLSRPVAVIGYDLADELFPTETPIGKDVILSGNRYQVVGVLEEKGEVFGQNFDMLSIVPITRMIMLYGASNWDVQIKVRAVNMQMLDATMEESIGVLRVIRRVKPGEENNFEIVSNEGIVGEITRFTNSIAKGGAAIGLITLLAAGIGIMNIMLVSVTERTREIGIRKAVGARRRDVLRQFLYEAMFLCQIGGIIGILAGAGGGNLVGYFAKTPFVFPWLWALIAVGGVTGIALIFGVYPAYKAAGLDPIEALRHE